MYVGKTGSWLTLPCMQNVYLLDINQRSEEKSPNFIRTKARHFDNLMSWLVRLGSIK